MSVNVNNFRTHSQIHSYTTRNNVNLYQNKCKYSTTQHSFEYNSVKCFNLLPLDIRNLSLPKFKRTVQHKLLVNPLYNILDFNDLIW